MEKYLERIESLKNSRSADELRLTAKKYGLILSEKEAENVFSRLKRTYQLKTAIAFCNRCFLPIVFFVFLFVSKYFFFFLLFFLRLFFFFRHFRPIRLHGVKGRQFFVRFINAH